MTPRLVYMNQNSPEWQNYIFGQMAKLFRVYRFDGWHIDTFGVRGAYAYDKRVRELHQRLPLLHRPRP